MAAQSQRLRPGPKNAITDVKGVRVGHWTNKRAATGCTAILTEKSKFAAVDVRGGAPASRETDVLALTNVVKRCDAIVLSGGSAFGLATADGASKYLAEHDVGFETRAGRVPIVPAACIFDLGLAKGTARPDAASGYRAAAAATAGAVKQGSIGAGAGATVAKLLGPDHRLKGGLGTASIVAPNGLAVGAIAVVNAVGNIIDPANGRSVAAPRAKPKKFASIEQSVVGHAAAMDAFRDNTTLVCLATNATIDHDRTHRLAMLAHDGMARAIVPAHTFGDGDIAFAVTMATHDTEAHDLLLLGHMAAEVTVQAILNAVRTATGLADIPSATRWLTGDA